MMLHPWGQGSRYGPALDCVAAAVRLSFVRSAEVRRRPLINVRAARQVLVALALSALAGVLCTTLAEAATIPVTTTDDEFNGGVGCSLREAIQSANTNGNVGGCVGSGTYGSDVITLPSGTYTVTLGTVGTLDDANADGDFDITSVIEIRPSGSGPVIVNGGGIDRVFHLLAGADLTLKGVTVTGGFVPIPLVIGNVQEISGPGIRVDAGRLTVQDGTITGNTTVGYGGGLFLRAGTTATLERVTLSNNVVNTTGGAIFATGRRSRCGHLPSSTTRPEALARSNPRLPRLGSRT